MTPLTERLGLLVGGNPIPHVWVSLKDFPLHFTYIRVDSQKTSVILSLVTYTTNA